MPVPRDQRPCAFLELTNPYRRATQGDGVAAEPDRDLLAVATNAQIAPSLGRNLAAGPAGSVTVDLIPPFTQFEDRITQLDFRLTKTIQVGKAKVQGMFNIYNALNGSAIRRSTTVTVRPG